MMTEQERRAVESLIMEVTNADEKSDIPFGVKAIIGGLFAPSIFGTSSPLSEEEQTNYIIERID